MLHFGTTQGCMRHFKGAIQSTWVTVLAVFLLKYGLIIVQMHMLYTRHEVLYGLILHIINICICTLGSCQSRVCILKALLLQLLKQKQISS